MTRLCALLVFALGLAPSTAALASNCYAFVEGVPGVRYAALGDVAARAREGVPSSHPSVPIAVDG